MAEIITLYSGQKVIRGGAEVFVDSEGILKKVLETGRLPKILKPEKLPKAATQKPKPKMTARPTATLAKPRLELPRQQRVAKPKQETVEIKPEGNWLEELKSLTPEKK